MVYLYNRKFSSLKHRVDENKMEYIKHDEQAFLNTIEDIIKPKASSSKHPEPGFVFDDEEGKTTMIKKRKLLEKIIYDALGLRKEGKLDEYEKKIIE